MPKEFKNEYSWSTANLRFYKVSKELQKQLKANQTLAEKLLWQELRNKKLDHKFRRQHIIDVFIVDFVCLTKKLVIEIDGKIHLNQKDYDQTRTESLNEEGYRVIRFTNEQVENEMEFVLGAIKEELEK